MSDDINIISPYRPTTEKPLLVSQKVAETIYIRKRFRFRMFTAVQSTKAGTIVN